MFRFLSTQVERLRESFSPSKTNPKKKKTKTKTNKGKSTTTHKTKKVKRETKTKTTTNRSTKQTKLGVKGGVAKNNKKKNGVAAKSKPPKRQNWEPGHGEREQEDLHEQALNGLGPSCP